MRAFSEPTVAYLGLLLLAEVFQRRGLGSQAYRLVEEVIRGWSGIDTVRMGILDTNRTAIPFWPKMGFHAEGEPVPYSDGPMETRLHFFEKSL